MHFLQYAKAAFLALGMVAATLSLPTTVDAHGYPPFGAWAYGSGPAVGYSRSRVVYRSTYRPSWHGWGGYGNYGFAATTRVHAGYPIGRSVYRSSYRAFPVRYSPIHYSRYYRTSVLPSAYLSTYYLTPYTYITPAFYSTPVIYTPGFYYSTPSYRVSYPVYPAHTYYSPVFCDATNRSPVGSPVSTFATGFALKTSSAVVAPLNNDGVPTSIARPVGVQTRLVSTPLSNEPEQVDDQAASVPTVLLDAADAILKAGGHREAAQAYAEISVRYGTELGLLERRFVANVLSGDLAQAEIIVGLAQLNDTTLLGHSLGLGGLRQFIDSPVLYQAASESLAKRALENPSDATAMRSVATWLQMGADHQRAELFFASARRIEDSDVLPASTVRTVAKPEAVSAN